jgi:2-dehydro-3-deoxyphosphooctonate aldolase (KDO 8-P synthase)
LSFATKIGSDTWHSGGPYILIAGPCAIESEAHAMTMAEHIKRIVEPHAAHFKLVYKSSFDKANRSSATAKRGVGMDEGLRILARVRDTYDLPVLTDIHESHQAEAVGAVVDVLQIPAFLCRQTDLLVAAAKTGKVVNVKKGQFLAPADSRHPANKVREAGNENVWLTERGTSFGYNNLVVDYSGFPTMRKYAPLIFDATHSVQKPGGLGESTGGKREMAPYLAAAAAAVGVDGFFTEVHDNPDVAISDGPNQLTLELFEKLLPRLVAIREATS